MGQVDANQIELILRVGVPVLRFIEDIVLRERRVLGT